MKWGRSASDQTWESIKADENEIKSNEMRVARVQKTVQWNQPKRKEIFTGKVFLQNLAVVKRKRGRVAGTKCLRAGPPLVDQSGIQPCSSATCSTCCPAGTCWCPQMTRCDMWELPLAPHAVGSRLLLAGSHYRKSHWLTHLAPSWLRLLNSEIWSGTEGPPVVRGSLFFFHLLLFLLLSKCFKILDS